MNQETAFLEKLRQLKENAQKSTAPLTDTDIQIFFDRKDLTGQQLEMIRDYLKEPSKESVSLSGEDAAYLREYEAALSDTVFNDYDLPPLFEKVLLGDESAREQLARAYMPDVLRLALDFKEEGIFIGDLVSEGCIGLTEGLVSITSADTAHKEILDSIKKSMRLFLLEQDALKKQDSSLIDKVRQMDSALTSLKEDLGRKVYIEEIAEYLKIPEDEVLDILKLTGEDIGEENTGHE